MDLKSALADAGLSQTGLAHELGIARSTVNRIVGKGIFPVGRGKELRGRINELLMDCEVSVEELWGGSPDDSADDENDDFSEECEMISNRARKVFGIIRDPFMDDVNESSDVFMNGALRYASEYMYSTAKLGGMLAVIGESGSGKTTLRRLLLDRITREDLKIKVIFPRTVDKRRLTASSVCEAIVHDCSNTEVSQTFLGA